MPDYVDKTDPTDQDADSIGCGMAFLSWLMSEGYALGRIAPAMVALGAKGTLAQMYAELTSQPVSGAWSSTATRSPTRGASTIPKDSPTRANRCRLDPNLSRSCKDRNSPGIDWIP